MPDPNVAATAAAEVGGFQFVPFFSGHYGLTLKEEFSFLHFY